MAEKKFTQVSVTPPTRQKISILAAVIGPSIYEMVESWTDVAWEEAKKEGLVTDAMLNPSPSKKNAQSARVVLAA